MEALLPVPPRCPDCGNQDLSALGQGTQRVEEHLRLLLQHAPGTLLGHGLQVDDLLGGVGVSPVDGLHQRAVFGHGLAQSVFGQRHQGAHHLQETAQVGDGASEPGVGRHGLQALVETVHSTVVVGQAIAGDGVLQAGQQGVQRCDVLGGLAAHGLGRTAALQQAQHGEEAFSLAGTQFDDEGAPPRHQADQSFMSQHLQGLAQRGAGGAQAGGQPQFVDALTGRQAAFVDHLAQSIGDFNVQGRAGDLVVGVHG